MTWKPFDEIARGEITDASFAASFWPVYTKRGNIDPRYATPTTFFERTYFSNGLRSTLVNVVKRVSLGQGDPVILLSTTFGGGKTHTLLAIYHLLRDPDGSLRSRKLREALDENIIKLIEEYLVGGKRKVLIAALDGSAIDLAYLKKEYGYPTYWRFLLEPLAKEANLSSMLELLQAYSDPRLAPGYEPILKLLTALEENGYAVVFLLDELSELLHRLSGVDERYADAMVSFLDALARAVAASRYSVAVYSLAERSISAYDNYNRRIVEALSAAVGRISRPRSIIGRGEAAFVLQSALLESIDRKHGDEIARLYYKMYVENADMFPSGVATEYYFEELRKSYPFHPHYVHLVYAELAQLPEFQATRDVLRLTARIIYNLYRRGRNNDYVMPSDVDVSAPDVLAELLDRHGYFSLRRAVEADKDELLHMDKEYAEEGLPGLALGVYSSVLMKSIAGKPMDANELRLSVARPQMLKKISLRFIEQVADRLEQMLTYFHATGKGYIIRDRPNLRRLVARLAKSVDEKDARRRIIDFIKRNVRSKLYPDVDVVVWPQTQSHIQDNTRLKIVYLDPDACTSSGCSQFMNDVVLYVAPGSYRKYRNTIVFVTPASDTYQRLIDDAKALVACEMLKSKSEEYGLDEDDLKQLNELCSELRERVESGVRALYHQVCYPISFSMETNYVEFICDSIDVDPLDVSKIIELLEDKQKVVKSVSGVLLKTIITTYYKVFKREISAKEIAEVFATDVEKPYILDLINVVYAALRELARKGEVIVLREGKPQVPFTRGIKDEDLLAPCVQEVATKLGLVYEEDTCKPPKNSIIESGATAGVDSQLSIGGKSPGKRIEIGNESERGEKRESIVVNNMRSLIEWLKQVKGLAREFVIIAENVSGDKAQEFLQLLSIIVRRLKGIFKHASLSMLITTAGERDKITVDVRSYSNIERTLRAVNSMLNTLRSFVARDVIIEQARIELQNSEKPVNVKEVVEQLDTQLVIRYSGIRLHVELLYEA